MKLKTYMVLRSIMFLCHFVTFVNSCHSIEFESHTSLSDFISVFSFGIWAIDKEIIKSYFITLLEPRMAGIVGIFASIGDHIPILNKEKFCQPQPEGK